MTKKQTHNGRLENWVVDPFGRNVIWGEIFGDTKKRFEDGAWIHTSSIDPDFINKAKEGDIVVTLNSSYLLGKFGGKHPEED